MIHILSSIISNQNINDTSVPKDIDKACRRAAPWPPAVSEEKHAAVPVTEDQVRGIFNRYDANNDGRLSKQELIDAFASLGSRMPTVRALLALHHADTDRDGYITKAEFEKLVKYTLKRGYIFK
ncbi:probable calcium-binding protein CML15 [Durio zibethinus]|uniref:Probable calcium-binding protein CML15 n=1 Tax=Durio zibethinus TaxID=66656 RepID=A0A6P6B560_DURZI|nr:probable calcium-binding protein CML15 [Durio zibethinus]